MGSPDDDKEAGGNEKPQHRVRTTRPFYLGVHEVTQTQYKAVMGNNPSFFSSTGGGKDKVVGQPTDQDPVENVSWLDAVVFCNKLSEKDGLKPNTCQFAEHLYSLKRILIRPVEAGFGMSREHSWGCGWQRLSQPGVERFAQAKKPQELSDDLW